MQLCVVMCGKESASKQESANSEQGVCSNNKYYAATTNLMQIVFSHSCHQQAASSKQQAANSKQKTERAASSEQLGLVKVLLTVQRNRNEGDCNRSEGDSHICCFDSSHLWNRLTSGMFSCASSRASGRSFVFVIMFDCYF